MSSESSASDGIDDLIDEFVTRQQAGESPSITDYCERYPKLADELRNLLPMVSMMDTAKSESAGVVSANPTLPDQIGDYLIVREIGRGGMGVVYEAQHKQLGRAVAVKVLAKRLANSQRALARFHREARAVAKLHHSNIVPLFEVGEDDGQSYLAMQLIKGTSLDELIDEWKFGRTRSSENRIRRNVASDDLDIAGQPTNKSYSPPGPASDSSADSSEFTFRLFDSSSDGLSTRSGSIGNQRFRSIVRIALQAAEALSYAHKRGIIHRDVKPSNILLDENGVVWLTDFGLAKSNEDEQSDDLTQTGDFLGTLRYMAPERFKGECDERADIYSLGLTLYEMLTGKEAFDCTDRLKLMKMIDESNPTPPRSIVPRIPRDLETIVLKSISKDAASRYRSAGALAQDLERFIHDQPIKARRHTLAERLVRWSRRNRGLATSLASIAALLIVIAVGATAMSVHSNSLRIKSDQQRNDMQQNLYFAQMNLAGPSALQTTSSNSLGPQLARWEPEKVGRDLRGWEWYYLRSLEGQMEHSSSRLFKDGFRWCWSVDYSPDGDEIVNTVNGWGIQVRSSDGKVLREKFLGSARFVHWSPDGTRIAVSGFGSPAKVRICDAQSLDVVIEIESAGHEVVDCARWSPDSAQIAVGGSQKTARESCRLRIYDAVTGELSRAIKTSADATGVDWSPDGSRIASGHRDNWIRVWNVSTGKMLAEWDLKDYPYDVRWNRDGTKLAIAATTPQCWHVGAEDEHPVVVKAETISGKSIAWHPQRDQLAVGGVRGVIQLLDGETLKAIRTLTGNSDQIWSLAWRHDGTQLTSANLYEGRVEIWNVGPDNQNFILHPELGYTQLAWMPDGNSIASTHDIWNLATGDHARMDADRSFEDVAVNASDGRIALGGQRDDVIVRSAEGLDSQPMPGNVGFTRAIGWSPDGRLANLSHTGHLNVWDSNGARIVDRKTIHAGDGIYLRWSSDGRKVATTAGDNFVRVWDASTWEMIWEHRDDAHPVHGACWSPDNSRLAISHDGVIRIRDGTTGEHLETLDELQENFRSLDWSPDGHRLAVGSRSSLTIWDVRKKRVALRLALVCGDVRWNADGRRLAVATGATTASGLATIRVLDARKGYEIETAER